MLVGQRLARLVFDAVRRRSTATAVRIAAVGGRRQESGDRPPPIDHTVQLFMFSSDEIRQAFGPWRVKSPVVVNLFLKVL